MAAVAAVAAVRITREVLTIFRVVPDALDAPEAAAFCNVAAAEDPARVLWGPTQLARPTICRAVTVVKERRIQHSTAPSMDRVVVEAIGL